MLVRRKPTFVEDSYRAVSGLCIGVALFIQVSDLPILYSNIFVFLGIWFFIYSFFHNSHQECILLRLEENEVIVQSYNFIKLMDFSLIKEFAIPREDIVEVKKEGNVSELVFYFKLKSGRTEVFRPHNPNFGITSYTDDVKLEKEVQSFFESLNISVSWV